MAPSFALLHLTTLLCSAVLIMQQRGMDDESNKQQKRLKCSRPVKHSHLTTTRHSSSNRKEEKKRTFQVSIPNSSSSSLSSLVH
jgi:hypothetical protein